MRTIKKLYMLIACLLIGFSFSASAEPLQHLSLAVARDLETARPLRIEVKRRGTHGEILAHAAEDLGSKDLGARPVQILGLRFRFQKMLISPAKAESLSVTIEPLGKPDQAETFMLRGSSLLTLLGRRPGALSEVRISWPNDQISRPRAPRDLSPIFRTPRPPQVRPVRFLHPQRGLAYPTHVL